ncbi:IPT/TIG domain-containing protein [uncultured Bacteroides sp.]|uniref:IPT/TIG domain-containing protein n=1 Tax=uncultured Bacteroides sp. TaxID=162156 RepID=UPI0025F4F09C|nr:IPT/TIG domain-containing protein [uncultured Bacteroides sp.]
MKKLHYILPLLFLLLAAACSDDNGETINLQQKDPVITVTSVNPLCGYKGEDLIISGENFGVMASHAQVFIGTVEAKIRSIQDDRIVVVVPDGASAGKIRVKVLGQELESELLYDVLGVPGVTRIIPEYGFVGDEITFEGHDFGMMTDRVKLIFNGVEESAVVVSCENDKFVVKVPEGARTGAMSLMLSQQAVPSLPSEFTVLERATLTSVSSAKAYRGSEITLNGTNFGTSKEDITVYFGISNKMDASDIVSCENEKIVIKVPADADLGENEISVATKYETIEATLIFTVMESPIVTSLSSNNAYVGKEITITGQNFGTDKDAVKVFFGDTEEFAEVVSCTNEKIVVKVPNVATGLVTLSMQIMGVAVDLGSNTSFTINETPVVTVVKSSNALSLNGMKDVPFMTGDKVVLTGTNFGTDKSQFKVLFGEDDVEGVEPTLVNDTEMVTDIPNGFTGGVIRLKFDGIEFDLANMKQVKSGDDITEFVLKNYGKYRNEAGQEVTGFQAMDGFAIDDAKVGTGWRIPVGWIVNDAVRNVYTEANPEFKVGGLRFENKNPNGVLIMQKGWGPTGALVNGKIYQTVHLPVGMYEVTINIVEHSRATMYFVVNNGDALLDIEEVATATAYHQFQATGEQKVSFTLSGEDTVMSVGLLGTMPNSGNSCGKVSSINIIMK